MRTAASLVCDQPVELGTNVLGRNLDVDARLPGRVEENEPEPLLVALERFPGELAVDVGRLWSESLLHGLRRKAGEPKRGDQAEPDRLAVRKAVARAGFEGVSEGVAEVEHLARAEVARIGQAD